MTSPRHRYYRGIKVYLQPARRKADPDNEKVGGLINFISHRKAVPVSKTLESMMFKARRLIDRELDRAEAIEVRWFRTPLI